MKISTEARQLLNSLLDVVERRATPLDAIDAALVKKVCEEIDPAAKRARPSWDAYFLDVADVVATRSTCDRKNVGAVIVSLERQILSTGYNGAPAGMEDCYAAGHEMREMGGRQSCVRTVHAEMNALVQAAKNGVRVMHGTVYTTASPCYDCAKAIVNAGIARVVFAEPYQSRYGMSGDVAEFLTRARVTVDGPGISFLPSPEVKSDR